MKLYVGNLPYSSTEEDLKELFSSYDVVKAQLIIDRETGRSKGFGFVELSSKEEGEKAMRELDKKDVNGKEIRVNEARPPQRREEGGGYGGGGGGRSDSRPFQKRRFR